MAAQTGEALEYAALPAETVIGPYGPPLSSDDASAASPRCEIDDDQGQPFVGHVSSDISGATTASSKSQSSAWHRSADDAVGRDTTGFGPVAEYPRGLVVKNTFFDMPEDRPFAEETLSERQRRRAKSCELNQQWFVAKEAELWSQRPTPRPPHSTNVSVAAAVDNQAARQRSYSWMVDVKQLRGNGRSVVSRPFELCLGQDSIPATFKLMLSARIVKEGKGGHSFKTARGRGSIQLKCEEDQISPTIGQVGLLMSIDNGKCSATGNVAAQHKHKLCRTIWHDFSRCAACTSEDWDFTQAVEPHAQTFAVNVEVDVPGPRTDMASCA